MEAKSGTKGIDLRDGMPQLLVLTCADDIRLFAKTSGILIYLLDTLVDTLEGVGLPLNVSKTIILTTETQLPQFLTPNRNGQVG